MTVTVMDGTFAWWMRRVDGEIERRCGLTSSDMSDMNFKDRFNDGEDPIDVAVELMENEGFPFMG